MTLTNNYFAGKLKGRMCHVYEQEGVGGGWMWDDVKKFCEGRQLSLREMMTSRTSISALSPNQVASVSPTTKIEDSNCWRRFIHSSSQQQANRKRIPVPSSSSSSSSSSSFHHIQNVYKVSYRTNEPPIPYLHQL